MDLKIAYTDLHPKMMLIANDFLPIKVENGKIIEPRNIYKNVGLQLGSNDKKDVLPVVLDTREETSVVPNEKEGLFIMTDMIYFVVGNRIQKYKLKDGVVDSAKFEKALEATSGLVSLFTVIFLVAIFSVNGIIKVLLASLIGVFALRLMKKENAFGFRALTRLSSILVALSMLALNHYIVNLFLIPIIIVWFLYKEDLSK